MIYDVFIYCALSNAAVNTFFYDENLLKETSLEELTRPIEGSQIAIVVFSETYSRSTCCLNQLWENHRLPPIPRPNPCAHIPRRRTVHSTRSEGSYSAEHREYGLWRWKNVLSKVLWLGCEESQVHHMVYFLIHYFNLNIAVLIFLENIEFGTERT